PTSVISDSQQSYSPPSILSLCLSTTPAPTQPYTLSLHDALPISRRREHDAHVRRELRDDLPARAARRRQLVVVDDDRDSVVVLRLAGRDRGEYRAALRANGQAVRRVLDVRAGVDLVALGAHRRSDFV